MKLSTNSYAALEEGLVSVWNFDDSTVNDSIGSNDGEFMNRAKRGPWASRNGTQPGKSEESRGRREHRTICRSAILGKS